MFQDMQYHTDKKKKRRFCVDGWKRIHPQAEDLRKANIPTFPQHPSGMMVSEDGLDISKKNH